ncbi:MAG: hypothetical protein ACRBC3_21830 [Burkholderiaceae bacterium]
MLLQKNRALLEWLGRRASFALPIAVFVGLALPPLANLMGPLLTAAVIGTLTSVVIRLDWSRLSDAVFAPRLPILILSWQLLASPLLLWWLAGLLGLPPALMIVVVLQAAAPPIGSVAAFALFIGLDATRAMVCTVVTTIALPVTLTMLVGLLLPEAGINIDPWRFFGWVSLVVATPFVVGALVRKVVGLQALNRNDDLLAGVNVILLAIFAIALMDGVTARILQQPAQMAQLFGLGCLATGALHLLGFILFRSAGIETALTAALISGNRNMGLILVVTAGSAGEVFALYVGMAQIPMYFAPLIVGRLAKSVTRKSG